MDAVRDRVAGAISYMLTEVRILTVLDETGSPIVAPDSSATPLAPDWRRPFVAREISPILPRWEVGAWLVDPGALQSTAEFTRRAVWVLVAVLFVVIASGGALVLRLTTAEMRTARQKTTFVANVSHELKTPLTSIRLFAELLLSGKQADEQKKREYLRTMVSETERLTNLVDNVLTFSRRDGGGEKKFHTERLSLAELARETCAQLEPYLTRASFTLRVDCADDAYVTGDREALRQVLMNILSNAEKYSGDSRTIDVRCTADESCASISVADRGIGVPHSAAEKIFDEFYRADDSLTATKNGAGLGLSIARDIAKRHGGDVTYKPRDGGGSVFTLRLPKG
jgi:signal transduction histidine kinase